MTTPPEPPPWPAQPPPWQPQGPPWQPQPPPWQQQPPRAGSTPTDPPKRPWWRKKRWQIPIGLFLVVVVLSAVFGDGGDKGQPAAQVASSSPTPCTYPPQCPTTAAPSTEAPATTAAATTLAPPRVTTKAPPPPKPKPVVYERLTLRQWKLLVKAPDNYVGRHYTVYGNVTQFDAATGLEEFLADASGVRDPDGYYFEGSNTMFSGGADRFADLVEGDSFTAQVTVVGSESYDTQEGGNTTVPHLAVNSMRVTG